MEYWVQLTVLTDLFDIEPPTTVAHNIRPLLDGASRFPIELVLEQYRDEIVPLRITREKADGAISVEELVTETDHSEATTLRNYLLTKLYDNRGVGTDYIVDRDDGENVSAIDIDHFFPAAKLRNNNSYLDNQEMELDEDELDTIKQFCKENVNRFGNYTLLPQGINQSKGQRDPEKWLTKYVDDVDAEISTHYLPKNRPYTYDRYKEFLSAREPMMVKELEKRLVLHDEITSGD